MTYAPADRAFYDAAQDRIWTLTSTLTAHDFYLAAGYADCGTKAYETGAWPRMEKALADG